MSELWNFLRGAPDGVFREKDSGVFEHTESSPALLTPLLVLAGGRERDKRQRRALLEGAGFRVESFENPIVDTCR